MQAALEQRALKLSILVTLIVSGLGVTFGLLASSQSILFDGVFSTIDAAMSGLALGVSRLAMREASERFQHGYWHLEPMVAALNGAILMLLCFYAFLNALQGLMDGGNELDFGMAIAYAVVVAIVCFTMVAYQQRINRRAGSEFVRIDMQGWLMAALITSALLVAFLIAPSAIDREVHAAMAPVMKRDGLLEYFSHVAKAGRGHFIEIHIITTPEFGYDRGMVVLDEIREQIGAGLSIPPECRWLTVAFTADPRWA